MIEGQSHWYCPIWLHLFLRLWSCGVFCGAGLVNVFRDSLGNVFESSVFTVLLGMWSSGEVT